MDEKWTRVLALVATLALVVLAGAGLVPKSAVEPLVCPDVSCGACPECPAIGASPADVTGMGSGGIGRFDRVQVDGSSNNPSLYADQEGSGNIVQFDDGGTAAWWVADGGDVEQNGTTPTYTLGDGGAEDTAFVFDGNAQDFYIGLDDTADDLVIGLGSAVGTTPAISVDESQNTDIAGTLQFGADNLYALGYASSGQQVVYGTTAVTGTATAAHGLTTVTFCMCSLGEDPTAGAGDAAMCTTSVSGNVCTLKTWQDDFVTAATETDVDVHWIVIGAP